MNNTSMGLLTDQYQLSMAYGYYKLGMADRKATFNLYFRKHPFNGHYTIAAGLGNVIELLNTLKANWFSSDDLEYLATLKGNDNSSLFDDDFLGFISGLKLNVDINAVPEGTVVYPNEPLISVSGPLLQCQLLETPLLNKINFSTLIATKAHRICQAAKGDPVFDFGLRRAQGMGCLEASRACYIGGVAGTSNVMAGKLYGIPVKGTMAHSWVMSFDTEQEAMTKYAQCMPNNTTLLVDTYDTEKGIKAAIEAGKVLRKSGNELQAVRLDSGDLRYLSVMARKMLDAAGFNKTLIVASNDLDEYKIIELKRMGARVDAWGVGTQMITGGGEDGGSLGGVYKLSAWKISGA